MISLAVGIIFGAAGMLLWLMLGTKSVITFKGK